MLPFTATIKGLCLRGSWSGKAECKKAQEATVKEKVGCMKESAGVVEESERGYLRGVREKENQKGPHRKAFV